ncbi:unnamed protein product [Ambrosiozyma monospora]|uniref:Unnamed protein product n=1 Tax=Ambrosiozyma monospora TaxID=43982 RepID=A0ACB5SX63_AMBMO|nr:unnamed protein product [Ambrosiozyma monospora]
MSCLKYCKLCRATTHQTDSCPEATECSRCVQKGHHVRQFRSKHQHYDPVKYRERQLEILRAKKDKALIRITENKEKTVIRQRRTTALKECFDKLDKELPIPLSSFWPSLGDAFTPSKKRKSNFPQPKVTTPSPKKNHRSPQ